MGFDQTIAHNPKDLMGKILRFTKIEHTAFSLPLIFAGAWMGAGNQLPSLRILTLIVTAAVGARIFGMAFNRIFDRNIDAKNPRTAERELPSGAMSVNMALGVAFSGLTLYLISCTILGGWCLILAPVPLLPLLGYSLLKRFTWFCHFGIGLCLALAPLGAFVAASGDIEFSATVLLFSSFVFFWMSGSDIIYALMDIESDRRNSIYSLPVKLGAGGAQRTAALAHFAALTSMMAILILSRGNLAGWVTFGVAAGVFILMYIPQIPVPVRFFPISTLAGIIGAIIPILACSAS